MEYHGLRGKTVTPDVPINMSLLLGGADSQAAGDWWWHGPRTAKAILSGLYGSGDMAGLGI